MAPLSPPWYTNGTYIRWQLRNWWARKEQYLLFDLSKAFDQIESLFACMRAQQLLSYHEMSLPCLYQKKRAVVGWTMTPLTLCVRYLGRAAVKLFIKLSRMSSSASYICIFYYTNKQVQRKSRREALCQDANINLKKKHCIFRYDFHCGSTFF